MTDKEIIKALECCIKPTSDCENCPYYKKEECFDMAKRDALNLINRQQAEIERLQKNSKKVLETCSRVIKANDERNNEIFQGAIEVVRAEAIKEFWNELKKRSTLDWRIVSTITGDNLVKEMIGE